MTLFIQTCDECRLTTVEPSEGEVRFWACPMCAQTTGWSGHRSEFEVAMRVAGLEKHYGVATEYWVVDEEN